jgi:hypothetical protein
MPPKRGGSNPIVMIPRENKSPGAVDVVYTWVDGDDPAYAAVRNVWAGRCGVRPSPERDRDNLELLRYSLRSLERYLPWHGRLYIVTARPQVPAWLKTSGNGTGARIVHHDEIFADPEALPTFNSFAIEHNLPFIPGLSNPFLYLNDDHLFGCRVAPRDFVAADGRVRLYLEKEATPAYEEKGDIPDAYGRIIANTNGWLDSRFGKARRRHLRHGPLWVMKGDRKERDDPAVKRCIRNRFRSDSDIAFDFAYGQALLSSPGKAAAAVVPLREVYLRTAFHRITNDPAEQKRKLLWLSLIRPKFYCLNDDMGDHPDPRVVERVRAFLERTYPDKSRFEK